MYRTILISFIFWTCGVRSQNGINQLDSISSGGLTRYYYLYTPPVYDGSKNVPLLINLHGLASNAIQQLVYGDFRAIADTAGFLIVHPEGSRNGNIQFWNAGLISAPDDVLFIKSLIDSVASKYKVDLSRVYCCGLSNGGLLSYFLACQIPGRIAAIASVAGTMPRPWFSSCMPLTAVPVMEIHGTEDGTIPFEGNSVGGAAGLYVPIDSVTDKWVRHNQCNSMAQITVLPDIVTGDQSTVTHFVYSGGIDGSSVELYKVNGGSHSWPGALPVIYKTNEDFSASAEIWRFFRKYRSSQFTQPVSLDKYSKGTLSVYPNPARERIYIDCEEEFCARIFAADGSLVLRARGQHVVELGDLPPGFYTLECELTESLIRNKLVVE